ncbi:MAG: cyanophycin synthetase [Thermomicrobiales bacterium]
MLELRSSRAYHGPNQYTNMSAIDLEVVLGDLEERPTITIPKFSDRLLEVMPSLRSHQCSGKGIGGFSERLYQGTWMGHVLQHVALELQALAGDEVRLGRTVASRERGVYHVVYEYRCEAVGEATGLLGIRLINHLLEEAETHFDLAAELEEHVMPLAQTHGFGPSTSAIVKEAERRGIPVLRLDSQRSLVQFGQGKYQQRIWATITSRTANIAVELADDKELTSRLLSNVGLPTTQGITATSVGEALTAAHEIGFPLALKPVDGNHGRGVFLDLRSDEEIRRYLPRTLHESRSKRALVERFVIGKDYRILVIDNQVVAVSERIPAHVVGDGDSSISSLVESENRNPLRGIGHEKPLTRLSVDRHTMETLAQQGVDLQTVPPAGAIVTLRRTGNLSTGGTAIDRTDEIHPDNVRMALQAVRTVGLDVAGIDLVCPDIARPVRESGGAIVEINAAPGFRMHTSPTEGSPRQPGRAVLDLLFPSNAPARIPVVAVTGTNGKTTTARMIAAILSQAGYAVGLTTTDGIYVDGEQIAEGDMAGPASARMVLLNPMVDCAVLECARGGILRDGLGFDRCNVGIVTNVANDHLGLGGVESIEDLVRVKSVVPRSVFRDGASVLNADNVWTASMASIARGETLFYSLSPDNPVITNHLRDQGRAITVTDDGSDSTITLVSPREQVSIISVAEIPATHGGLIRVNIANSLAAIAGAIGLGISLEVVRRALTRFTSSYEQTPGRFNFQQILGRTVMLDYCHNTPGLEVIADMVARFAAPSSTGVIAVPGDRRDEDVIAFGRLAARTFERIVIREDSDTRGRVPGDIARLLEEGAGIEGMPENRISIVLNEQQAARAAIEMSDVGDLVVITADNYRDTWSVLQDMVAAQGQPLESLFDPKLTLDSDDAALNGSVSPVLAPAPFASAMFGASS